MVKLSGRVQNFSLPKNGKILTEERKNQKTVPNNQHPVGHDAAGTAGCSVLVFGPHIPPGPAPSNVQGQTEVP